MAVIPRSLRRFAKIALGRQVPVSITLRRPSTRIGSEYGGWELDLTCLDESSTVFSCGVGEDISFDLELIARTGATVHAFDPTPKALSFITAQQLPDRFHFHPVAIGDRDGTMTLYPPKRAEFASWTSVPVASREGMQVPVRRVASLAKELGITRLDVLKLDIEGGEYGVIDTLLSSAQERLAISQILIEFHHRLPGIGAARTRATLRQLRDSGYQPYAISEVGDEISFFLTSAPAHQH